MENILSLSLTLYCPLGGFIDDNDMYLARKRQMSNKWHYNKQNNKKWSEFQKVLIMVIQAWMWCRVSFSQMIELKRNNDYSIKKLEKIQGKTNIIK